MLQRAWALAKLCLGALAGNQCMLPNLLGGMAHPQGMLLENPALSPLGVQLPVCHAGIGAGYTRAGHCHNENTLRKLVLS